MLKTKGNFVKGYTSKWTEELFIISEVCNTSPITYRVMDLNNEEIKGKFYEWELLRSNAFGPLTLLLNVDILLKSILMDSILEM